MYQNNAYQQNRGYGPTYTNNYPQQEQFSQILTQEEINKLRNTGTLYSLKLTPEELLKSKCMHKLANGTFTLDHLADGRVRCNVCGAEFDMNELSVDEVKSVVDAVIEILHRIKTYWLQIPQEVGENYFQIIPLIEKITRLYEISVANFHKLDNGNGLQPQGYNAGFNLMDQAIGGSPMGAYYAPQGMNPYGMPQMNPYGMPQMNPYQPDMSQQANPYQQQAGFNPYFQQQVNPFGNMQQQQQQAFAPGYGQQQQQPTATNEVKPPLEAEAAKPKDVNVTSFGI